MQQEEEGEAPTAEAQAKAMLRYLAELYDIPEENLAHAAMLVGARCLFEAEVLLCQVREGDGWLTVADTLAVTPPEPWRKRDERA